MSGRPRNALESTFFRLGGQPIRQAQKSIRQAQKSRRLLGTASLQCLLRLDFKALLYSFIPMAKLVGHRCPALAATSPRAADGASDRLVIHDIEFGKMSKSRAGCGEVMRQILIRQRENRMEELVC